MRVWSLITYWLIDQVEGNEWMNWTTEYGDERKDPEFQSMICTLLVLTIVSVQISSHWGSSTRTLDIVARLQAACCLINMHISSILTGPYPLERKAMKSDLLLRQMLTSWYFLVSWVREMFVWGRMCDALLLITIEQMFLGPHYIYHLSISSTRGDESMGQRNRSGSCRKWNVRGNHCPHAEGKYGHISKHRTNTPLPLISPHCCTPPTFMM